MKTHIIDPGAHIGQVTLAVADAERSMRFYNGLLGFEVLTQTAERLILGAGSTRLIELHIIPGLKRRDPMTTGLFHAAVLLPGRLDLAHVLRRILDAGVRLGASDHLVSEALYLNDPDGNGLEIYRDRPRDSWRWPAGSLEMATLPLDLGDILRELEDNPAQWDGIPEGTSIGHMHLQIGDVELGEQFYRDVLGFELTTRYPGASFLSAGGYHHHLGINIWNSRGAPPSPLDRAGLRSFEIVIPSEAGFSAVKERLQAHQYHIEELGQAAFRVDDPWQNNLIIVQR